MTFTVSELTAANIAYVLRIRYQLTVSDETINAILLKIKEWGEPCVGEYGIKEFYNQQ